MPSYLCEAIEVVTDSGLGVPVSYANSAIGLMSDGHIVLITGRPNIVTATGDSTRTDWAKTILTLDFGNWTISRNIDFVEAGAFETVSDFTVGIKNTSDFRNTLQSNGVYLGRRRVKYYRVTSTDGSTWNFELRWTGVVDDQPFNERTQTLKCVSTSKDIFGTLPTVPANKTTFPLMPDDSQDKMIPIALGRVARSPLLSVSGSGQKTILNMTGDLDYSTGAVASGPNPVYVAACLLYDPKGTTAPADGVPDFAILQIGTTGKSFVAGELKGKYVNIISGGVAQSVLIADNEAYSSVFEMTQIYLADNLDVSTPFKAYFLTHTDTDFWYCEIADYAATLLSSTRPISEFIRGRSTPVSLVRYLSDSNFFDSIGEAVFLSSLSNVRYTGFPGVFAASITSDNGSLTFYSPVIPTRVYVAGEVSFSGLPAVGSQAPLLCNGDPSDYYTIVAGVTFSTLTLDLLLASESILKQFEALYVLFDLSHQGPTSAVMRASASAVDFLGRETASIVSSYRFKNSPIGSSFEDIFRLPGSYYNIVRDDANFFKEKDHFDIQSVLSDTGKLSIYNRVRFQITGGFSSAYTMRLRQVGLVGKRSIAFTSETVYSSLRGELYGNTMDSRVSATDYPDSAVRVLEYLIRNYDEKALPWQASHAYTAGAFVRGTADTGHVFVCTVAGTSSASEPTWTDTTGATYTDGGVTWKEHHEIPIDTASFDTAASHRGFWLVGRTLTEKKNSLDYYKQLLAQSFLLGVMTPAGKVQVKAWLQDTTPLVAFSEANILPGTLSDVVETPMRRLYNLPTIKYDKNPASGSYNKQMAFTNIDKPSFPGVSETTSDGVSLGAFTATALFSYDFTNPTWAVTFVTSAPHNRATGDYLSLSGNADGFNFSPAPATVIDANTIRVPYLAISPIANPSTSGTLFWNSNFRLKWHDYVAGIENYSTARDLWRQFHNSYLVTQVSNPVPDELSQCEWFFDLNAKDANGKYIFSGDGGETPDYDLGDAPAVLGFAQGLANWTAWKKKQVTMEVADNATFSARGLGDCVSFSDAKLTAGSPLIGWIHEKTQLPRTAGSKPQPERFRFGITLYPEALNVYAPPIEIIESGSWPDTITESGSRTDTYTEGA